MFQPNLSTSSKKIVLQLFIIAIVSINLLMLYTVYNKLTHNNTNNNVKLPTLYDINLAEYVAEYEINQKKFENFSFYINYDRYFFHNNQIKQGYEEGIGYFSNITQEQYYSLFELVQAITRDRSFAQVAKFMYNHTDWTRKDAVIRDERGFNTSFIFASLTALEYQINKPERNQSWVTLSVQEIIDCCPECMKQRRPAQVFEYIKNNGISQQKQYPYENSRFDTIPKKCRKQQKNGKRYYIQSHKSIRNCPRTQKQLKKRPIVVGLDGRKFSDYNYGIFQSCQRKTTHYGTLIANSAGYWKLQNSWGRKWGQRGYIRIGPGDSCGICLNGEVAVLKQE